MYLYHTMLLSLYYLLLTLCNIVLFELTPSLVTSLMTFSNQSESELVSLSCMPPVNCSAHSIDYVGSWDLLARAASLMEMLIFLAFFRILSLYFLAMVSSS